MIGLCRSIFTSEWSANVRPFLVFDSSYISNRMRFLRNRVPSQRQGNERKFKATPIKKTAYTALVPYFPSQDVVMCVHHNTQAKFKTSWPFAAMITSVLLFSSVGIFLMNNKKEKKEEVEPPALKAVRMRLNFDKVFEIFNNMVGFHFKEPNSKEKGILLSNLNEIYTDWRSLQRISILTKHESTIILAGLLFFMSVRSNDVSESINFGKLSILIQYQELNNSSGDFIKEILACENLSQVQKLLAQLETKLLLEEEFAKLQRRSLASSLGHITSEQAFLLANIFCRLACDYQRLSTPDNNHYANLIHDFNENSDYLLKLHSHPHSTPLRIKLMLQTGITQQSPELFKRTLALIPKQNASESLRRLEAIVYFEFAKILVATILKHPLEHRRIVKLEAISHLETALNILFQLHNNSELKAQIQEYRKNLMQVLS